MRRPVLMIAKEIQRYALANPQARDTAEGIAWWIRMQREDDLKNDVADAIALLVRRGFLRPYLLPDGSNVFGLEESLSHTPMSPPERDG